MHLAVSVLSALHRLPVASWEDLRAALAPGDDGLLVQSGRHRATLLPSVWDQLPDGEAFLDVLWHKAGLPPRAWPADLQVQRYSIEGVSAWARSLPDPDDLDGVLRTSVRRP